MNPLIRIHYGDFVTYTDDHGTIALDASIMGDRDGGPSAVYLPPSDEWDVWEPFRRGQREAVAADLRAVGLKVADASGATVRAGDPESTPYRTLP